MYNKNGLPNVNEIEKMKTLDVQSNFTCENNENSYEIEPTIDENCVLNNKVFDDQKSDNPFNKLNQSKVCSSDYLDQSRSMLEHRFVDQMYSKSIDSMYYPQIDKCSPINSTTAAVPANQLVSSSISPVNQSINANAGNQPIFSILSSNDLNAKAFYPSNLCTFNHSSEPMTKDESMQLLDNLSNPTTNQNYFYSLRNEPANPLISNTNLINNSAIDQFTGQKFNNLTNTTNSAKDSRPTKAINSSFKSSHQKPPYSYIALIAQVSSIYNLSDVFISTKL